tara:strand:- start:1936 stop:2373 length:438 start_codon:yes stop_codon:yes gene_type:complete
MKQLFSLLILSAILHLGACKKEECPDPDIPYTSTMKGESSTGLRFSINFVGSSIDQSCEGWFLSEVYDHSNGSESFNGFNIQVVEGLSDSIKEWHNFHEKEFIIDFEFIGTGYECALDDGRISWTQDPSPYPVEQVKISHIEEAP